MLLFISSPFGVSKILQLRSATSSFLLSRLTMPFCSKSAISIGDSTLIALKYIVLAPTKKLFSFELKNESLKQLELLAKVYFDEKCY